jgi:hypothetical protein
MGLTLLIASSELAVCELDGVDFIKCKFSNCKAKILQLMEEVALAHYIKNHLKREH